MLIPHSSKLTERGSIGTTADTGNVNVTTCGGSVPPVIVTVSEPSVSASTAIPASVTETESPPQHRITGHQSSVIAEAVVRRGVTPLDTLMLSVTVPE